MLTYMLTCWHVGMLACRHIDTMLSASLHAGIYLMFSRSPRLVAPWLAPWLAPWPATSLKSVINLNKSFCLAHGKVPLLDALHWSKPLPLRDPTQAAKAPRTRLGKLNREERYYTSVRYWLNQRCSRQCNKFKSSRFRLVSALVSALVGLFMEVEHQHY